MTTRALVTGANGFVAQWTMRAMLERGWSVTAAGLDGLPSSPVLTDEQRALVEWVDTDVTVQSQLAGAVDRARAGVVVHLAAVSHVPDAARDPGRAYDVNVTGTVRLLAELHRLREAGGPDPVVLVVGSAEQYGRHDRTAMPLPESAEQRPLTPYAASKVAQEAAALQRVRADAMRVVCTRSFNHSGVGHAESFLLPGLVRRALALPPAGGRLTIGNGATIRDFLHVTDVVAAYLALLERGTAGEAYNVCSGHALTVRELAESVLQQVGITAEISSDPGLARSVDVPTLVGSNAKLRRATGWAPTRSHDDIIDDLIHAATR